MDFKLITDSSCDLPYEWLREKQVDYVSMIVNMDGKEYVDDMGESFDREWFFNQLKEGHSASTSQINTNTYYELFKKYVELGQPVLYLAFSSALSGSYGNAVSAVDMLKEEFDHVDVRVFDTKAACLGEGMLVYRAVALKEEGKSRDEVADWLEEHVLNLHSWVTVDDLNHLERGGRISKTAATVGSILNVKPIIRMDAKGALISVGKARGRKKSLDQLVKNTLSTILDAEHQELIIGHVGCEEDALYIKEELQKEISPIGIKVMPYGPTIASHTGFGSLAVFSMGVERS